MSNREKCIAIIDSFDDTQLVNIMIMLQAARDAITEAAEAADDAFCQELYKQYEEDPDKDAPVSLEEAARRLGVSLE